jgi:hypothetical protein
LPDIGFTKTGKSGPAWSAAALPALGIALLMLAAAPAATAATDPLAAAYAAAFADPNNLEAQLRYARAAEAAGKPEAAFPVYERVLSLQPNNAEAQAGLRRIRAAIQPSRQETFVEFGVGYESNPLHTPSAARGEFQLFGNLAGTYEHSVNDTRFRTLARLNGVWHGEQRVLNYGYAGAVSGPLFDIGANALLHLGLGGGVSTFSGRLFYYEALASLTYEVGAGGATQSVRLRGAWRHYDPFWVSDQGFWADITGKFIHPLPQQGGAAIVTPWLRWSGINGTFAADDGFSNEIDVTPGRYIEGGARFEYLHEVTHHLSVGVNVSGNVRQYTSDVVPLTSTNRQDLTVSPGVSIVLPRAIGDHADIRLRYNYVINNSNDDAHDFRDHVVALSLATKF